jgi:hypothetical protein
MSNKIYKINTDRPEPSRSEIEGYKNFNKLLKAYAVAKPKLYQKPSFWLGSGLIAACSLVAVLYFSGVFKSGTAGTPSFINPPFSNIRIQYKEYEINADSGKIIDYASGTRIIIPAGAFADENGNILKGRITLKYREFRDIMDCIVSGIPMSYDSAGKKYDFQTAGMFDISAVQQNKNVAIANGKNIQVQFASLEKDDKYNFYKLDTVQKRWTYLRRDTMRLHPKPAPQNPPDQDANSIGNSEIIYQNGSMPETQQPTLTDAIKDEPENRRDTLNVKLNNKKLTVQKLHEKPQKKPTENLFYNEKSVINTNTAESDYSSIQGELKPEIKIAVEPIVPRKGDPKLQKATFDFDVNEYPELKPYQGITWEIGKENKNFDQNSFNENWENAVLSKSKTKGAYELLLTNKSRQYHVLIYPVFNGKDFENAKKIYDQKFKEYELAVKDVKKKELLKQLHEKQIAEQQKKKEKEEVKSYKQDEEKRMKLAEQQRKKLQEDAKKKYDAQWAQWEKDKKEQDKNLNFLAVVRVFSISSFGVYNCDHPCIAQNPVTISGNFKGKNGTDLILTNAFLVDKTLKTVRTFNTLNSGFPFTFDPEDKNVLFCVLADKKIAVYQENNFKSLISKNNQNTDIIMETMNREFEKIEDFKDFVLGKKEGD